jgi:hypothetical protein
VVITINVHPARWWIQLKNATETTNFIPKTVWPTVGKVTRIVQWFRDSEVFKVSPMSPESRMIIQTHKAKLWVSPSVWGISAYWKLTSQRYAQNVPERYNHFSTTTVMKSCTDYSSVFWQTLPLIVPSFSRNKLPHSAQSSQAEFYFTMPYPISKIWFYWTVL